MLHIRLAAATVALLALTSTAAAQTELAGTLGVSSSSIFRGVTDTNRPVIEGEAFVVTAWRGVDFGGGAWAAAEPTTYDGSDEISLLGEYARPGLTQGSLWADASVMLGSVSATVGTTAYLYPAAGDLAETYNTVELYGILALDAPLAPTLTLYHDVARIRGAYLEAGVEHELITSRVGDLSVGAGAGWSLGQADGEEELGYFAENGLTHADLFASASRGVGAMTIAAEARMILGYDGYTRVVAPDRERATKLWLGFSVGWSSAARTSAGI